MLSIPAEIVEFIPPTVVVLYNMFAQAEKVGAEKALVNEASEVLSACVKKSMELLKEATKGSDLTAFCKK